MKYFRCSCCGDGFKSNKPKDPERDNGFGTCEDCHEVVAESWVKHGFISTPLTIEMARERLQKYA